MQWALRICRSIGRVGRESWPFQAMAAQSSTLPAQNGHAAVTAGIIIIGDEILKVQYCRPLRHACVTPFGGRLRIGRDWDNDF